MMSCPTGKSLETTVKATASVQPARTYIKETVQRPRRRIMEEVMLLMAPFLNGLDQVI